MILKKSARKLVNGDGLSLIAELLEPRMMLSTVQVIAAGGENTEQMQLLINDSIVQTFDNVGGDGTSYNQVDPRTFRVQDIDNLSGKVLRIDPLTGQWQLRLPVMERMRIGAGNVRSVNRCGFGRFFSFFFQMIVGF